MTWPTIDSMGQFWTLGLFLALNGVSAQICSIQPLEVKRSGGYVVSSQQDVDDLFQGCTETEYPIIVTQNYSGPLVFPNTTTSVQELRTYSSYSSPDPYPIGNNPYDSITQIPDIFLVPNLTAVVGDSVARMGYLSLTGAPSLVLASFKNLTTVSVLAIIDLGPNLAVDFPSLQMVNETLIFDTPMSTIDFPVLTSGFGQNGLIINSRTWIVGNLSTWIGQESAYPLVNISFPALESAYIVNIIGNISSLYMPKLSGGNSSGNSSGIDVGIQQLSITAIGTPLDVDLPNLEDVETLSLSGEIQSFSLPTTTKVGFFTLKAGIPLNVSLAPIGLIAESLSITGNVTSLNMSSVHYVGGSLYINSTFSVDCASAASAWAQTFPSNTRPQPGYSCSGHGNPAPKTLKVPLGVGLGVGIPVLLAAVAASVIHCRRRRRSAAADIKPPKYEMEPLPTNNPASEHGSDADHTGI